MTTSMRQMSGVVNCLLSFRCDQPEVGVLYATTGQSPDDRVREHRDSFSSEYAPAQEQWNVRNGRGCSDGQ